jgi:hypothetical protein
MEIGEQKSKTGTKNVGHFVSVLRRTRFVLCVCVRCALIVSSFFSAAAALLTADCGTVACALCSVL